MNILMIGDVYGHAGRAMIEKLIKDVIEVEKISFVIANAENITNGRGTSREDYNFLKHNNVDILTGGNHTFDHYEAFELLQEKNDFLRPANYNKFTPGKGTVMVDFAGIKIRITNLLGRTFMNQNTNNFYEVMDNILEKEEKADIHIVDFHGEASSEKLAFAHNYKNQLTAVVGTHTHVQTADDQIIDEKLAYITDIGLTGAFNSIIGANTKEVIFREKTGMPIRLRTADGAGQFCAVVIKIDNKTFKPTEIKRIFLKNVAV